MLYNVIQCHMMLYNVIQCYMMLYTYIYIYIAIRSPFGLSKRDGWVNSIGVRGGARSGTRGPKLYKMEVLDLSRHQIPIEWNPISIEWSPRGYYTQRPIYRMEVPVLGLKRASFHFFSCFFFLGNGGQRSCKITWFIMGFCWLWECHSIDFD